LSVRSQPIQSGCTHGLTAFNVACPWRY
jgi:hypothetical protein